MNRTPFYLAAIALHLAVLLWIVRPMAMRVPPIDEKKYVEVTLSTEPGPARPGPDSGPSDQAKAAAAPGPLVQDSPPPVATIAPVPTPPAPAPPAPGSPPSAAPPSSPAAPSLSSNAPPALIGIPSPNVNPPPTTGNGSTFSGAPVSGTGHGNAKLWSLGAGGNGHFYEAVYTPDGITWLEAQKYALLHGGYLATLTSAAENKYVFSLVSDPKFWRYTVRGQYSGPWFGGCNMGGVWQWVNGEGTVQFQNWYPTEPEEHPGDDVLYGLHFYTEDKMHPGENPPFGGARGPQRGPRGPMPMIEAAKPGPTWDVLSDPQTLPGFVVEYNSNPAKLPLNPAAAINFDDPHRLSRYPQSAPPLMLRH